MELDHVCPLRVYPAGVFHVHLSAVLSAVIILSISSEEGFLEVMGLCDLHTEEVFRGWDFVRAKPHVSLVCATHDLGTWMSLTGVKETPMPLALRDIDRVENKDTVL